MKIICPYCGCNYEIDPNLLKDPIGNEKLGYGWWLRCYKCHKKWWLKHSDVEMRTGAHLSADRKAKIEKISKLKGKREEVSRKILKGKYILLMLFVALSIVAFYKKDAFIEYISNKAKHLSETIVPKLNMDNVKYTISESDKDKKCKITVSGKIVNEDKIVAKFNGIEIYIFDSSNNEIKSWKEKLKTDFIMAGDSLDFVTSEVIEKPKDDIKVEVAIF